MSWSKTAPGSFSVPATADILRYLVHAFAIPAKASEISHKDLQRLGTRKLSKSNHERVGRAVIDVIAAIDGGDSGDDILRQIEQRFPHLDSAQHWYADHDGGPQFDRVVVMRDLTEFLQRNHILREALGDRLVGEKALFVWLFYFAIPFVAANLVDYTVADVDWDAGMPGGRHWFLPQFAIEDGNVRTHLMPSALVMRWWQDLLGVSLNQFADELCPGAHSDTALKAIKKVVKRRCSTGP